MEEITRFRSDIPRRTCHCTPCASCTNGKLLSRSGDDLISDFIDLFSIGDTASSWRKYLGQVARALPPLRLLARRPRRRLYVKVSTGIIHATRSLHPVVASSPETRKFPLTLFLSRQSHSGKRSASKIRWSIFSTNFVFRCVNRQESRGINLVISAVVRPLRSSLWELTILKKEHYVNRSER